MKLPEVDTGLLDGTWPFVKVGEGDRILIVFPGIHDALQDVTISPKLAAWFCTALGAGRAVYLLVYLKNVNSISTRRLSSVSTPKCLSPNRITPSRNNFLKVVEKSAGVASDILCAWHVRNGRKIPTLYTRRGGHITPLAVCQG